MLSSHNNKDDINKMFKLWEKLTCTYIQNKTEFLLLKGRTGISVKRIGISKTSCEGYTSFV